MMEASHNYNGDYDYDGDDYDAYDSASLGSGDLADDLHDLSMQQQHMPLLELPAPCLQRLAALLPPHRGFVLRRCNRTLQQLVEGPRGIGLVLEASRSGAQHAAALTLSAASLKSLDTRTLSETAPLQQLLNAVQAVAGGLPELKQLSCNIEHLELLNAVAAVSPQLSCVTLFSERDQAELLAALVQPSHEARYVELLQEQLPGLSSLRLLHLQGSATLLPLKSANIARTIGGLTQLHSLILDNQFTTQPLGQTCWIRMVAPLTGLSRLAVTSHDMSNVIVTRQQLSALQSLVCEGLTELAYDAVPGDNSKWYSWVAQRSQLTHLKLVADRWQISGLLLSRLRNLRSLTLQYTLGEHDVISLYELLPLAACSQLTHLAVDSLMVEAGSARQLTSLRSMAIGLNGVADYKAPLSTFAPNLTALTDVFMDWDNEWGESPHPVQISMGTDALKGLDQLQLLALDVAALDYHVTNSSLTQLTGLQELHISLSVMQPILETEHLCSTGLPYMQQLTKLVLASNLGADQEGQQDLPSMPSPGPCCLQYTSPESHLLWQHQSNLRCLQLKDFADLGGFMADDALLALLPQKLPQLQCVELERCRDLGLLPLAKLVGSRAAGRVVVRSWKHVTSCEGVSEQTCTALGLSSGGAVQVEYCW